MTSPVAPTPASSGAATRWLMVCADGYGQAPGIDRAIARLAGQRRITDISCLVNGPRWPQAARALVAVPEVRQGKVRTGLHFNLTLGEPLSPALKAAWPRLPPLQQLIVDAHLGRLPLDAVRDELQAQFDAYVQHRGRAPHHLDGHQHVHHLPGVRDLVLALVGPRADIRVRHTGRVQGPGFLLRRLAIEGTGGRALGTALAQARRHANWGLWGCYDFRAADYRAWVRRWLQALPEEGGLLYCHPGERTAPGEAGEAADAGFEDPIADARERELAYFEGPDYLADLQAAGVQLR